MIRLRLQMLSPLSTRCSWKRRTSSAVAVSGERPRKRGEAPAAVDVASLRMAPQLAGSHILDHTPTQRADGGISAHGELLLSEVANTSSSSGRGSPPRQWHPRAAAIAAAI